MIDWLHVERPLYPIVSILASLLTIVGSLALARSIWGSVFIVGVLVLLFLFGYGMACLKVLPIVVAYLAVFSLVFYFASGGDLVFTWQMANRIGGVTIAVLPGLFMQPVRLTRCLTSIGCPRLVSLGMLIATSFIPVLAKEVRQVRSAMQTRGVTSLWNPKAFYRALVVPLLVRLVNISDTLALSVETRGFIGEDAAYTVFHPVALQGRDVAFSVLLVLLLASAAIAPLLGFSGAIPETI